MYRNKSTYRTFLLKFTALIGLLYAFNVTLAQERTVQGTVVSVEDGEALPV
jgi:hypothetical protein